ncbi:(d)CMP kinase [Rickettsiella endosymbiont of Xylota segnis]|uniref:(d)CMP kinase n=1 Tax=Rickettsiella endosymbiont of Xylota segnis TaxID=3066238 RepID=UPI0030D5A91D
MLLTPEKKLPIPVITIDGPSGSGKGTISHLLAQELGWHFLDSGAIYRAAAWIAIATQTPIEEDSLIPLATNLALNFSVHSSEQLLRIFWRQQDITDDIRTEEIGQLASKLGGYPKVRQALLAYQRAFRRAPGLVADGRDMGSIVFPDAQLKIFLEASLEERAKRRYLQLKARGKHVSLNAVRVELEQRDRQDRRRPVAPLIAPKEAITIDTTHLSIQEVLQLIKSKLPQAQAKT